MKICKACCNCVLLMDTYRSTTNGWVMVYILWVRISLVHHWKFSAVCNIMLHWTVFSPDSAALWHLMKYNNGLGHDCGNSSADALELPQSCTKPKNPSLPTIGLWPGCTPMWPGRPVAPCYHLMASLQAHLSTLTPSLSPPEEKISGKNRRKERQMKQFYTLITMLVSE